jgi:hypothetical protein
MFRVTLKEVYIVVFLFKGKSSVILRCCRKCQKWQKLYKMSDVFIVRTETSMTLFVVEKAMQNVGIKKYW